MGLNLGPCPVAAHQQPLSQPRGSGELLAPPVGSVQATKWTWTRTPETQKVQPELQKRTLRDSLCEDILEEVTPHQAQQK